VTVEASLAVCSGAGGPRPACFECFRMHPAIFLKSTAASRADRRAWRPMLRRFKSTWRRTKFATFRGCASFGGGEGRDDREPSILDRSALTCREACDANAACEGHHDGLLAA
jgi:hypothetical protein